ncbi:hypothetical protein HOY80DRAFT_1008872 [Tuber brumale]|nr:hypothetical protein HOY80DRAFT_1008872 [Tuber brumale]
MTADQLETTKDLPRGEYRIYESYHGRTTRFLQPGEMLGELSREVRQTPAEEDLYARVAQQNAHSEGVGDGGAGVGDGLEAHRVGQFATCHIRLPPSVRDRTEPLMAEVATSHIGKRELTIPSNLTNIPMSGIHTGLFSLRLLTKLRKRLGGDLMFGWDRGIQGVKNVLDVGGRGARRTGEPPPGPGGKGLPGRGRGVHCGRWSPRLLDDTLFVPRVPDIYFENLHYTLGALMEGDKAQPRKLDDLIIAASRILLIGKSFFRCQNIKQLWWLLNPNGRVVPIIEIGMPICFQAVPYARPLTLGDCIQDAGKAFQSPPTKNSGGFANPPIEKEPGTATAYDINRKDYCRFSQRYERPGYLQKLMDERLWHSPLQPQPDTPIQTSYIMQQLCNYNLRKNRWGDLWVLGAKARTSRNIKIGGRGRETMSTFVAIKDPHGDGVRTIIKNKTTTFLKAKKKQVKEAKEATGLQRKRDAREAHKEKKEKGLQEKAMAGKGTGGMHEETIRMRRARRGMMQLWCKDGERGKR